MLKKMMLLSSMALAAVAFAVPASASAQALWAHDGVPLSHETVTFSGFAEFHLIDSPVPASFGCVVHATVTIYNDPEAHGDVTDFEVTTETCEGTGVLKGCQLIGHSNTAEGAGSWTVDVTTEHFTITNVQITDAFNEGCAAPGAILHFPEITAAPDNAEEISSVTISGLGESTGSGRAEATGTLTADQPGTYGII
jgi:hypothetical protein